MQHMGTTLLISIKPEFAELIFGGTKTVELRRTRPRIARGDRVVLYVSFPERILRGTAIATQVVEASPADLWKKIGHLSGINRSKFFAYFEGASYGYGIVLDAVQQLSRPWSLAQLRRTIPDFHPPQIYRYFTDEQVRRLGIRPSIAA
jgi:predicted transcriptional regulator